MINLRHIKNQTQFSFSSCYDLRIDKQFLITRNVACYRRCKQMEYVGEETMVEMDGPDADEGGWVETHHFDGNSMTELEDNVCEMTLDSTKVKI